jgi:hypothetical protein
MPKPSFRKSKNKLRFPLALIHYNHNKYFAYIDLFAPGIIATILHTGLYIALWYGQINAKGETIQYGNVIFTPIQVLFALLFINFVYIIVREFSSQGVVWPGLKERVKIANRKYLTAANVAESLSFVDKFKDLDKQRIHDYRKHILNIMKSNLESYFHLSPSYKKRKISVSLVVQTRTDPVEYEIVSRDSESLKERGLRKIKKEEACLYKPVEAIIKSTTVFTDEVSYEFGNLKEKKYKSVIAFPILWSPNKSIGSGNEDNDYCLGAISIDCTERYRFNGAEEEIKNNLYPYSMLLLYSFTSEIMALNTKLEGGKKYVSSGISREQK